MSVLLDTCYLQRIQHTFILFKKINTDTYNFRCPICGDSETHKNKARGYIYKDTKRDKLNFKCHNCNASMGFNFLLKKLNPTVYKEYVFASMDAYKSTKTKRQPKKNKIKEVDYKKNPKLAQLATGTSKYLKPLTKISFLDSDHPAKRYLIDRLIPEKEYNSLYFTETFMDYVNFFLPDKFQKPFKESRIVIPLRTAQGEVFGVQGRTIDPDCNKRYKYITIIFKDSQNKIYGTEKINPNESVLIVEGPFDSLFLDNCIAACGSSINTVEANVYMLDNEPRNKSIVKVMDGLLKKGKKVVILTEKYSGMDINDLILAGNSKEEIKQLIIDHTYSGVRGQVVLKNWRKC